jgi:hypothetical protein
MLDFGLPASGFAATRFTRLRRARDRRKRRVQASLPQQPMCRCRLRVAELQQLHNDVGRSTVRSAFRRLNWLRPRSGWQDDQRALAIRR